MTTLTFLLTEAYADWELAHLAATARSWYGVTTRFVTFAGGSVTSAGGLPSADLPPLDVSTIGADDGLILIGGAAWRQNPPDLGPALAALHPQAVLGAICDATRVLAQHGLLNDQPHTANDAATLDVPGYRGQAQFCAAPAVRSGRIVTASGTAPVAFMAEVLAAIGKADANLVIWRGMLAAEHQAMAA